ncbi:dihydropyrimidinase [Ammoniphilus resinae]|uniref:Dihydropyrimidinase n=1 Tax=Ammoniphilus resinae TaxID=861532 RepID=A0ABS4GPK1_9BACL|nr:dihydropyrimidinase [Ammoniphilus resinae]MBP1932198.1 dihydropyrimidinase [Ammoniphilus resinae]
MLDLMIKNGTVVNANGSAKQDVGIKDGKVVMLGDSAYFPESKEVIDAKGQYVLPGFIDSHVHVNLKMGEFTTLDSFYNASLAAAFGGTTTMVEFAIPYKGETPLDAVVRRKEEADNQSVINYSFHGCVTNGNDESYRDVAELITGGIPTIKMFTVYKDVVMVGKGEILQVLKIIKEKGGLAKFHAESDDIIDYQINEFIKNGKTTPMYHPLSRPSIAEAEAVSSLLTLIEHTEAPAIFVHMSTGMVKEQLKTYRNRLPVFTEVCPHYLMLSDQFYNGEDGQNYICSPPLRPAHEIDGLWEMVQSGLIDVINSDHCCYDTEQKNKYKTEFYKAPNGLPGIETRGTVFFSEAVMKNRITINQFVDFTSTKAAKLMGMYPKKGVIGIGSDADVVVFDPRTRFQITAQNLHMQTDYTPFEGFEVTGSPVHTIINGKHIIANGNLKDDSFRGQFIKRGKPILN